MRRSGEVLPVSEEGSCGRLSVRWRGSPGPFQHARARQGPQVSTCSCEKHCLPVFHLKYFSLPDIYLLHSKCRIPPGDAFMTACSWHLRLNWTPPAEGLYTTHSRLAALNLHAVRRTTRPLHLLSQHPRLVLWKGFGSNSALRLCVRTRILF
jgi:hypothetical protein